MLRLAMLRLVLILLLWAPGFATAAQAAYPTRLTISTTLVSNGQPAVDADLTSWNSLLATQLVNLINDSRYNLANARLVRVEAPRFEPAMPDLPTLQRRWEQTAAIQIIAGSGVRSGNTTDFNGWIYLGGLAGDLPGPTVQLREPIRAASYQITRDAVTLAALYALAVDAGATRSVACPLLARATQVGQDLIVSRADLADLRPLLQAVAHRLGALKCRPS